MQRKSPTFTKSSTYPFSYVHVAIYWFTTCTLSLIATILKIYKNDHHEKPKNHLYFETNQRSSGGSKVGQTLSTALQPGISQPVIYMQTARRGFW